MRRVHSSVTDRMETAEEQSVLCRKCMPISRGLDLLGERERDRERQRERDRERESNHPLACKPRLLL